MRKLLGLLLAGFLSCNLNAFAISGDVDALKVCGNDAASTSVTALAADADEYYRLFGFYLASDSADEVSIKIGSTTLIGAFLAANGGIVHNLYPLYLQNGTDNEAVTIAKTGSTDLHYCIWYEKK